MNMMNKAALLLAVTWSVLLAGCEETKTSGNYRIYVSDGWRDKTIYCDSYERNGYELKCFKGGAVAEELILNSDFDISISAIAS